MDSLSLVELKKLAKGRRIKQYYIMKRVELIRILSMNELPQAMKIEKMTIRQLRDMAKERGVRGFWSLNRAQLVDLLFPAGATNQDEQDKSGTEKHDTPQKENTHDVGVEKLQESGENRTDQTSLDVGS